MAAPGSLKDLGLTALDLGRVFTQAGAPGEGAPMRSGIRVSLPLLGTGPGQNGFVIPSGPESSFVCQLKRSIVCQLIGTMETSEPLAHQATFENL
jgi:hypothetical protein